VSTHEFSLKGLMVHRGSRDVSGTTSTNTMLVHGVRDGLHDLRMTTHTKIIIAAPHSHTLGGCARLIGTDSSVGFRILGGDSIVKPMAVFMSMSVFDVNFSGLI
jgi:hypothetical protein